MIIRYVGLNHVVMLKSSFRVDIVNFVVRIQEHKEMESHAVRTHARNDRILTKMEPVAIVKTIL